VNLLGVPRHTADDAAIERPCPECGEAMRRLRFPRDSRVTVDECKAHGVWFDPDELAASVSALTEVRRGLLDQLIWLVEHWP
jgi:Zn-finger nucleic acid-binding protein